jgi:hypothetical protein
VSPAEARRYVLMDMLDHAARRSDAWHQAAQRHHANTSSTAIAAEWDATRERLLAAITKHDEAQENPTAAVGNTRARASKENAA